MRKTTKRTLAASTILLPPTTANSTRLPQTPAMSSVRTTKLQLPPSSTARTQPSWLSSNAAIVAASFACLFVVALALPMVNALPKCPTGCSCVEDTFEVTCSEGILDVMPITLDPYTQRLTINNNKKIKTIDSSLQFYGVLTFLDLSNNEIVTIPERTFIYQKKLRELQLNDNKIGQINKNTFVGMTSLTVLNLRGNLIAELERDTFTTVSKVEELNLGANRISTIDLHAFDSLVNLRVLYLDDNTLTVVPTTATFQAMPSLAELFLGTNSFESLPVGAFAELKGLTRLDLRSAGLVNNISTEALSGLGAGLRSLDLTDNRLQHIPTLALSHLTRLEELSLGQNDFQTIPAGAFAGLTNLRRLDVAGALQLERIADGAFADNSNLEYLNLSGNKLLTFIEPNSLRGLPHLRHILLKENNLNTLSEELFPWTDLQTLDLAGNPIDCDCHVLWLHDLLVTNNASGNSKDNGSINDNSEQSPGARQIANVVCAFPERFRGESLAQLSPMVLGCLHTDQTNQSLVTVLIVVVTVALSAIVFLLYGCRRRIRETLKGGWGSSPLGRKEREYQKTFSDEEYMTRQQQQHPCLGLGMHPAIATTAAPSPFMANSRNYNPQSPAAYMSTHPIPVTEL